MFGPVETAGLRIISLGAGVQSTTMLLMAQRGEFDGKVPDCAIFSDTGWEPKAVYAHLEWLKTVSEIPIHVVQWENIRERTLATKDEGGTLITLPFHLRGEKKAMTKRQCTDRYKIAPIRTKVRSILEERGLRKKKGMVEMWIGISLDEVVRMKPSQVQYIVHRWPLIERRMSRLHCLEWMRKNGFPEPPKSSCIGCPFHNDAAWRHLRDNSPEEFADAIDFDRQIRHSKKFEGAEVFLHRSAQPLEEVNLDLSSGDSDGQMFLGECEGMCGV